VYRLSRMRIRVDDAPLLRRCGEQQARAAAPSRLPAVNAELPNPAPEASAADSLGVRAAACVASSGAECGNPPSPPTPPAPCLAAFEEEGVLPIFEEFEEEEAGSPELHSPYRGAPLHKGIESSCTSVYGRHYDWKAWVPSSDPWHGRWQSEPPAEDTRQRAAYDDYRASEQRHRDSEDEWESSWWWWRENSSSWRREGFESPKASIPSRIFTLHDDGIPRLDLWGADAGRLMEALRLHGAAYVDLARSPWTPAPAWTEWLSLFKEAMTTRQAFQEKPAVWQKLLSLNRGEDLARTVEGSRKSHAPDNRYNFGVTWRNAMVKSKDWDGLSWIAKDFQETFWGVEKLARYELAEMTGSSASTHHDPWPPQALDGKLLWARRGHRHEQWSTSRLRHSVYPTSGSCAEHTDYGVLTLQQCTSSGLEGLINGSWRPLRAPEGCLVVYAGDMLEVMTNGYIPALRHRVSIEQEPKSQARRVVRQSHIFFLQPDKSTLVRPLRQYCRGDGKDREPVRYGDWHELKSGLAFVYSH